MAEGRTLVYELDESNWRDCCRMKFKLGLYMQTWIEQVDGRYRGVFGSATGFGYVAWFDELEEALRWANADGGAYAVLDVGSSSSVRVQGYSGPFIPSGPERPDHLPGQPPGSGLPVYRNDPFGWDHLSWWERLQWDLALVFHAVLFLAYCAFLFVLIPWLSPWLWPLIPICIVAAMIGWKVG